MISTLVAAMLAASAPAVSAIEAKGPDGPLAGTLVQPVVAVAPVVLIMPGSGPTDRDGNNPLGINAASYRLIAEGLAARGIASVRVDKRGLFGSKGAVSDPNAVSIGRYADDVHAWIAAARERTGARCIWVLGHSEGGLVALAAAQQPKDMCGLLLLAAPGRRITDLVRDQLRANPANAPVLASAEAALDAIDAGQRVDTNGMHPALLSLFNPAAQGYLIDMATYDPAKLAGTIKLPMLILQGQRDIQVGEVDARRLAAADPKAKLVLLPDTNHLFKTATTADMAAQMAIYADPNLPLAPGVIDALADFIEAHPAKR